MKAKLLIAEDDINLGAILKQYLSSKGFDVELAIDGEKALKLFMEKNFDICILDVMMPKMDGFTVAKKIKNIYSEMPIIFLTAKSFKHDVIHGFELGADDYITKPFEMEELLMRIEAILRRVKRSVIEKDVYNIGKYVFDSISQKLIYGDEVISLTSKESELLKLLASNINEVVERNYALKLIWGNDSIFSSRSMDVYITKLRKYLNKDEKVKIVNVHSKGFKLVVE